MHASECNTSSVKFHTCMKFRVQSYLWGGICGVKQCSDMVMEPLCGLSGVKQCSDIVMEPLCNMVVSVGLRNVWA